MKIKVFSTKLLDKADIEHLAGEAQRNVSYDRERREGIEAGIEAENMVAAAEAFLEEVSGAPSHPDVEAILSLIGKVKEAAAAGIAEEVRLQCNELRQRLETIQRNARKPSESVAQG